MTTSRIAATTTRALSVIVGWFAVALLLLVTPLTVEAQPSRKFPGSA